ncbi:MAG: hypothetical protein ACRDPL_12345 [Propionibacteriaceae bacterium]
MHESLPFDEATAPSLVSTGELPQIEQVRDAVTEAYERFSMSAEKPSRQRAGGLIGGTMLAS